MFRVKSVAKYVPFSDAICGFSPFVSPLFMFLVISIQFAPPEFIKMAL